MSRTRRFLALLFQDSVREAVASYKFIHAKNVQRPQLQFQDKIDNSSASFIPLLREKPNALKPLPESTSPVGHVITLLLVM